MPPRRFSRHMFSLGIKDADDNLFLTDREPFLYRELKDNRTHVVGDGDTLFNVAARYFKPIPRAAGLWWVVADFQPEPIHDPTLKLEVGSTLVVPSVQTVMELLFSEQRRTESVA